MAPMDPAPPPPPQPVATSGPVRFSPSSLIHAPLSALLEYSSGMLRAAHSQRGEAAVGGDGEVSIRIVGDEVRGPHAPGTADAGRPADVEAPPAHVDKEASGGRSGGGRGESLYQGYDVQWLTRWVEHALPFTLLLLGVLIRQHLQGFFMKIWIAAMIFKSNDILRKQTALKDLKVLKNFHGVTWNIPPGLAGLPCLS